MIEYSLIQDQDKYVAVRSTVKSMNLDHVTDKDLSSFFTNFSKYAHFDTGLLPLDGTGLLAYRQAGNHAQIVVQTAPAVSRILWGQSEGGKVQTYFLAQPYKIYIGDILDGNFYGARIFYSYNPITSPSQELYHTNLPNMNCRGYRGNAVGWVCLYHTSDWSNIPLGEKVARLIERCSGDEAYNDGNMSETDGPRFYAMNGKPSYVTDPTEWEKKTTEEGFLWTLNEGTWIPVLVQDQDNQDKHYEGGVPLTLGMALTGDYQAYYTDNIKTKPVNKIARKDKSFDEDYVFSLVKKSYELSRLKEAKPDNLDPYTYVQKVRDTHALSSNPNGNGNSDNEEHDENDQFICLSCEEYYDYSDDNHTVVDDGVLCQDCYSEQYVYCENVGYDVHMEKGNIQYLEEIDTWVDANGPQITHCMGCGQAHYNKKFTNNFMVFLNSETSEYDRCTQCFEYADQLIQANCAVCSKSLPMNPEYKSYVQSISFINPDTSEVINAHMHNDCSVKAASTVCPCGKLRHGEPFGYEQIPSPESIKDIDQYTMIALKDFFNPFNLIAIHYGIQNVANSGIPCQNACASCVCFNQESMTYEYDPSKFELNNFEALSILNQNSINHEQIQL
jgi:hypothetical protein